MNNELVHFSREIVACQLFAATDYPYWMKRIACIFKPLITTSGMSSRLAFPKSMKVSPLPMLRGSHNWTQLPRTSSVVI